jgi:hypothetical protein
VLRKSFRGNYKSHGKIGLQQMMTLAQKPEELTLEARPDHRPVRAGFSANSLAADPAAEANEPRGAVFQFLTPAQP